MTPSTAHSWIGGFTQIELDEAQQRYGLSFPEDLLALLRDRRLVDGYDWSVEDPRIRRMLAWPFDMLAWDVEQGLWWPDWGKRPASESKRREVLRDALDRAPKLIPLYAHRFLPAEPLQAGNPVFSMHGFDTVYYGVDLADYLDREFSPSPTECAASARHIAFWSDLVENFDRVESVSGAR